MPAIRHILATCVLVATFEQPIGHSMDGLIKRHTINYCHRWSEPIQIVEEIIDKKGTVLRVKRTTTYPIPPDPEKPEEPKPTDPTGEGCCQ